MDDNELTVTWQGPLSQKNRASGKWFIMIYHDLPR